MQQIRYSRVDRSLTSFSLTAAIVIAIIAFSAIIISRLSEQEALLLFAAVVGVGAVIVLLRYPPLGLLLLVFASMSVPIAIGTGTQTSIHSGILLLFLLTGLWLGSLIVGRGGISLRPSKPMLPLAVLVLSAVLAFAVGQLSWFSVSSAPLRSQVGGLSVFVLSAAAFLLVAEQIEDERWLQWMTWLFVAIGAANVIAQLIPIMAPYAGQIIRHGGSDSLFWVWLVALTVSQGLFNSRLPYWLRLLLILVAASALYITAVRLGSWKSGWVPSLAVIAALVILRWPRLLPFAIVIGVVMTYLLFPRLIADDQYSYSTRIEAWQILTEMLRRNPLLGYGPANYYWYTPLYAIRGYHVNFNSHSQYVDLLLQVGIVGLLAFLWFFWSLGKVALSLPVRAMSGFSRAYVYGVLAALLGTLIAAALGDWVLPFVYNIGLGGMRTTIPAWMLMGGLLVIERKVRNGAPTEVDSTQFPDVA